VLGRLGFAGRLSAILMLALLALWALGAGLSYVTRAPIVPLPGLLPLPHQMAAIVELLETSSGERRATILAAASSDTLRVTFSPERPDIPPETRRRKGIEWIIARYVGQLGSREVIVTGEPMADPLAKQGGEAVHTGRLSDRLWRLAQQPLRLSVALQGGGYAVFETQGEISRRLFGLPPGFWLGAMGSLVGIAALVAVWRETRPLKELSKSVSRFSGDGQPVIVRSRGAPELKRLIDEVNRMQERIATLIRARSVLLGAVSHDLKTYITRLKLRAELIADEDQQRRVGRDLDDMTALIEDALAVARGTALRDRVSTVDLAEVLRTVSEDLPNVELSLPQTALYVEGDPTALRRLFANLVDNALRYGKACSINAASLKRRLTIHIDDKGPGIPESERALVLEPFYRLETSRNRETGGSGLGLAIAKQIAEAHGGTIELGDAPSGGLRVTVVLSERQSGPEAE